MRAWLAGRFLPSSMEITLNSGSLIATTGVTSALGVAYWWLAAHEFPASAVGLAGALVSAMTLLGVVSTIGFSTALIPKLAESSGPSRAALILGALMAVSVAGVVLGTVWQAVAPRLEPGLGLPETGVGAVLLFAAGVSLTALALVLDQALVGLLRGELQLFRNTVFAVVKLLALLAAGVWVRGRGAETIYATWAAGQVASLVALAVLVARGPAGLVISRPRMPRALRGAALVHHAFNLALAGPSWILPLIVTVLISTTANAYFYTAWTVAGFVFVGPIALTTVLYAVGAQPARDLGRPLQLTLLLSLFWGVVTAAGCLLLGSTVLGTFGRAYGLQAGSALFLLSLAVFPQVAKLHYVALARIRGQLGVGILLALAGGMLELALAAFGAQHAGIRGLATGWLVATCVEAAAVLPYLVRSVIRLRRQHPRDGQAPSRRATNGALGALGAVGAAVTTEETRRAVRLALVTPRFHPFTGGVETHVHEVATRLAVLGFDVTVLTADVTRRLPRREQRQGVSVRRFPATPWLGDLQWAPGIFRAVADGGWDLVHVQCVHTLVPPMAMTAARRRGLPYVVSFHTGGHSSLLRNAFRPLQWRLQRPLLVHAAGLLAVSEFEARLFQVALGLDRDRFTVVRNGFEMPRSIGPAGGQAAGDGGGPVILSVGRLERYKGHHRAIGAMGAVVGAHPEAELYIVGTGPFEAQLRRQAEASVVSSHVHFVNFTPERRAELARLVARAQLVTLLSEYEAHPVAVMEAVGLGRRVLVGATSGLHELAEQGLASEVSLRRPDHEIGELMAELLRRPEPEAHSELQTWDSCVDQLTDLYRSVLHPAEVCPA